MKSQEEIEAWCFQAYGMTKAEHEAGVNDALTWTDPVMLAGSIMSDCQELLRIAGQSNGNQEMLDSYLEEVRQQLNRAKSVLFEHAHKTVKQEWRRIVCDNKAFTGDE